MAIYRRFRVGKFGRLEIEPPPAEPTPAGDQFLIEGVAPITAAERLKQQLAANLTPAVEQKPCNEGLFDDGARDQLDLLDLIKRKGPKP